MEDLEDFIRGKRWPVEELRKINMYPYEKKKKDDMNEKELRKIIMDSYNDMTFEYNGKKCGVFPTVYDSKARYSVWCGDNNIIIDDPERLLSYPFFEGKSIQEIISEIEIQLY